MPLYTYSGAEAVAFRKNNPAGGWGDRSKGNRLEPLALPEFETPFKLAAGESIFTIGSCFARNVETNLIKHGFKVPVRELFDTELFTGLHPNVINNYGTPSIFNEFSWALEDSFRPEDHLLEVRGGFIDLHLQHSFRPGPYEAVLARRLAIIKAMKCVAECRVIVATLGLAEVWFDNTTDTYLNVAPRPSLLKDHPGRFELHVLSFDEAHDFLVRAIDLLKKHGRPDLKMMLTVSPVPLAATHRPVDVMVANSYSKSVLRAVAETVAAQNPFIAYFPSYESVTLSDRQIAWQDDLIHVTDQIVSVNVGRMIRAYTAEVDISQLVEEVRNASPAEAVARAAEIKGGEREDAFFEALGDLSATNPGFALAHARHLEARGKPAETLAALANVGDYEPLLVAAIRARALMALDRAREAAEAVEAAITPDSRVRDLWSLLVTAYGMAGDSEAAVAAARRYKQAVPGRGRELPSLLFRALRRTDAQLALRYGQEAIKLSDDITPTCEVAELLISLGRAPEADALLSGVSPVTVQEGRAHARAKAALRSVKLESQTALAPES